jgi:hypothetical protein
MSDEFNIYEDDAVYMRLAREIALDHYELPDILKRHNISHERWSKISNDKYFTSILSSEISHWNTTANTTERSKLKAAALIEDWLPEAHTQLHNQRENLSSKVALATLVTKIAGMGLEKATLNDNSSDKFVVNINLGPDKTLNLQKEITITPHLAIEQE